MSKTVKVIYSCDTTQLKEAKKEMIELEKIVLRLKKMGIKIQVGVNKK